jgi:phage regulator Rha-like protein
MSRINAVEKYTENGITLYDVDGIVMTTTESIAKKFGKTIGNVNEKLKKFPDYNQREVLFKIKKSHKIGVSTSDMKSIDTFIDRDTMTLLVMGFSGISAFEWKNTEVFHEVA